MAHIKQSPQVETYKHLANLKKAKIAIVTTEWNSEIVTELKNGAYKILEEMGAEVIDDLIVPGAFELVNAANMLCRKSNPPEAILVFGCVIQGGTPHFEYVCDAVTSGISHLNAIQNIPIIFGVLTLNNEAQAWERLGGPHGHKGEEAAIAALKMIQLHRMLT